MLPHLPLPEILIKKPHPQAPASVAKQAQKAIRIEALVARPPRLTEQAERAFRMWGFSPRWRSARAEELREAELLRLATESLGAGELLAKWRDLADGARALALEVPASHPALREARRVASQAHEKQKPANQALARLRELATAPCRHARSKAILSMSAAKRAIKRADKKSKELNEELQSPQSPWSDAAGLQGEINECLRSRSQAQKQLETCERMLENTQRRTEQQIVDLRTAAAKAAGKAPPKPAKKKTAKKAKTKVKQQ